MKSAVVILLLLVISAASAADPVAVGMTTAEVLERLGQPRGRIEMGEIRWWTFENGEVRFRNDRVVEVNLTDPEVFAEQQRREAEARAANRREGEALRDQRLNDVLFLALPARERFNYWQQFSRRFPEVDVMIPVAQARAELAEQQEQQRLQQELTALNFRVREAELQAQRAEQQARDAMWMRNREPARVVVFPQVPFRHHPHHHETAAPRLSLSGQIRGVDFQYQSGGGVTHTHTHSHRVLQPQPGPQIFQTLDATRPGRSYVEGRSHGLGPW